MMGAAMGTIVGPILPGGEPALWPLVFMAATLGGMMRAPIMATVFAFELTHDANVLLPLLMASAVAYGFTVLLMRRSILTEKIARPRVITSTGSTASIRSNGISSRR